MERCLDDANVHVNVKGCDDILKLKETALSDFLLEYWNC